jgi:hypothetical protein
VARQRPAHAGARLTADLRGADQKPRRLDRDHARGHEAPQAERSAQAHHAAAGPAVATPAVELGHLHEAVGHDPVVLEVVEEGEDLLAGRPNEGGGLDVRVGFGVDPGHALAGYG